MLGRSMVDLWVAIKMLFMNGCMVLLNFVLLVGMTDSLRLLMPLLEQYFRSMSMFSAVTIGWMGLVIGKLLLLSCSMIFFVCSSYRF